MAELEKYIIDHCAREDCCICKNCYTATKSRENGHAYSDVQFFRVVLKDNLKDLKDNLKDKELMKNNLIKLIKEHRGIFSDLNLLDGEEHNFVEIGGWLGSQNLALMLMGMGEILDLWQLNTPNKIAPALSIETRMMLAQTGYISIIYKH